ncbi:MAG: FAD-dependent oxidoreductase [Bacteroidia bacterium]
MSIPDTPKHYAIIGGGLAGSLLAARLCMAGQAVSLFDDAAPAAASRVAAGMFNIVTGRFGALTWQAATLLGDLRQWLAQEALAPLRQYVHDGPIFRPFHDAEDYNKWSARAAAPEFAPWIDFSERPLYPDFIHNPLGGIRILACGWMDTGGLITALQDLLVRDWGLKRYTGNLLPAQVDLPGRRIESPGGETIAFDDLVCAQGYRVGEWPWWRDLPLIPNKGELLLVEPAGWTLPLALSKKVYVVPLPDGRLVVGSTYEKVFAHTGPTGQARSEIGRHLDGLLRQPYSIVGQWAGVRPTTPNRRPIVGTHPHHPHLHLLTGFGTKGVLLAPYCSRLLAARLLGQPVILPAEIDLARFG